MPEEKKEAPPDVGEVLKKVQRELDKLSSDVERIRVIRAVAILHGLEIEHEPA